MRNLLIWEIRKNIKKNAIIGISIAMVAFLILFAVTYNMIADLYKEFENGSFEGEIEGFIEGAEGDYDIDSGFGIGNNYPQSEFYKTGYLSKAELETMIESTKENIARLEEEYKNDKNYYSDLYAEKSTLSALEYAKKEGLFDKKVRILGLNYNGLMGDNTSGEGFTNMYVSIISVIVLIYGIILGANLYTSEYKSGTIKLVMARPITKNALTTAKLVAMYLSLIVMFLLPALLGYAYGGIAFGSLSTEKLIYSFNGNSASLSTIGAFTFASIMVNLINILVMATISFALATIFRNAAVGLVASLAVVLGIGSFLSSLGANAFLLSNALDLTAFFGVNTGVPIYGNFFLSLGIVVFWTALSLTALYIVTNKRDVN